MNKQKRYLISTADELTWKFDRPVVFLGDWCRLYDRKHIWNAMDAVVAVPYGLGQEKKNFDHAEARRLEGKLFPAFCALLNQHHGSVHSDRFWQIVLGHWFRRVIDVMINRVNTLEQCLEAYEVSGTTLYSDENFALSTLDSYSAIWAFNDQRWNNTLTLRILNLLEAVNFPIEYVIDESAVDVFPGFRFKALADNLTFKRKILNWCCQCISNITTRLVRENDAFIINSYLPVKESIKLELALVQCPQMWQTPKLEIVEKPDGFLRANLTKKFVIKSENNLENILRILLFELLPVCYLEGYVNLNKIVCQQPWPKLPKFIFTSNNFDTDEVFKLWTAMKVESGSKYITGQHGNNYGTYRYMWPAIEEMTADKFLTWGWTDELPQHTPAFVFNITGVKAENFNPQGGLLLIEDMYYHRLDIWDRCAEHRNYFSDQVKFTQKLLYAPLSKLIIRLHSSFKYNNPCEKEIWYEVNPDIKIDNGDGSIKDLIAKSRLIIHSYDSTGILETLSLNIPTLAFWQNDLDHLRESAKPYYQILLDAGIVHLSAESVAEKVNAIWDDVDGWWGQSEVQAARRKFCERYARLSQNPVRDLKQLILEKDYERN